MNAGMTFTMQQQQVHVFHRKKKFNGSLINTVVTIFVSSYYKFKHSNKYRKADSRVIFCMLYTATTVH